MRDLELLDNLIVGRVEPHIYAFTTNTIPNYLKIGDTYRPVSIRLKEWQKYYPGLEKQFENTAKVADDVYFRDYSVHQYLESDLLKERLRPENLDGEMYFSIEFFKDTTADEVSYAIADITSDYNSKGNKYQFYNVLTALPTTVRYASTGYWMPRPNQQETINTFKRAVENGRTNLLMYAVMRFGKSFTSMCCAKEMDDGRGARLVVVVSAKADVKEEWRKTVECAENFRNDYEFLSSVDLDRNHNIVTDTLDKEEKAKKVVLFLTLQDLQGDMIKDKHQQIFGRKVDLLIIDETHFGARAEKYGQILKDAQFKGEKVHKKDDDDYVEINDAEKQIKSFDTKVKLHLSGTPYRILMGGEFQKEDMISFYQFSDIVQEQEAWDKENLLSDDLKEWDNPYYGFPQMVRFAFNPNESSICRLEELRRSGVTYAFSALFKPKSIKKADDGSHREFFYENEILDLLKVIDGSKEDENLLGFLDYEKIKTGMLCRHVVCVLPYCAACDAMEALIKNKAEQFRNLSQYEIINISGIDNPSAYRNPKVIKDAIKKYESEDRKTITLTVNRMLTGSTVEEWDTMLYLKDTASPQEYDQAIFRLQNQYVKKYEDNQGDTIKYNMKPQTLLVDFDPNRMFQMQEQKAQIYNVNVDDSGNSKLSERLAEELRISPIIVMNKDKIEQITATDILKAVSEYSSNRGVAAETNDIPVDLSLMDISDIWSVISTENEIGSTAGFEVKAADGEGIDMDTGEQGGDDSDDDTHHGDGGTDTTSGDDTSTDEKAPKNDPTKQFRMYYARILYFAFLTKDTVISLDNIIDCIDTEDNSRIFKNLGLSKNVLTALKNNMDKFILRTLDYKIQNLNQLSHDDTVPALERAIVANQKFGKLGESQVVTPEKVSDSMIALLSDDSMRESAEGGKPILDIASKEGEFAISLCKRYESLDYDREVIKDIIYSIPTSSITYEFTRKIYEVLGLNVGNIAEQFDSYDLLNVKTENGGIDFTKIRAILNQSKPFNEITMEDEVVLGGEEEMIKFGAIVGNPPYQEGDGGAQKSARPIYQHFVTISKNLSPEFMTFIIPSRWYAGGKGKDLGEFRENMLNDKHIKELHDFLHPEVVFPDTNNRGGVCYFLWDKNYDNVNSHVKIVTHENIDSVFEYQRPLKTGDLDIFIRDSKAIEILDKVLPSNEIDTFSNHISAAKAFGFRTFFINDQRFRPTAEGLNAPIMCYGRSGKTGYVESNEIISHRDWIDLWKVYVAESNNIGTELNDDNQNAFVGNPHTICTETFLVVGADLGLNEISATNLVRYLKTKFARFLHGLAKISQHGTAKTYQFVPVVNYTSTSSIDWSKSISEIDAQLYTKYGLAQDEIDYIESKIKLME